MEVLTQDLTQSLPQKNDVEFFEQNGYWIAPKLISDERLEQLRAHMERIYNDDFETGRAPAVQFWRKGDSPQALRKTDNTHWSDQTLRDLATDQTIGATAARLMRAASIRLWHDQLLYKPGTLNGNDNNEPANVGWHQDYYYWQCAAAPTLLTAWVAFDDVDLSNGCMQVVRGSNNWGLLSPDVFNNNFFEQNLAKQQESMKLPEGTKFEAVPLIMKAGQISFHHCLTLHGSGPNNTARPRRSLAVHLMTGNTHYRAGTPGDVHMNVGFLGGRDGDLFEGDYFPICHQN